MDTKRVLSVGLIAGILSINYMPCMAYSLNKNYNVIKAQVNDYKFQNVNLDWWKSYNDEYLDGYIVKAIDNSQDLRIATLRVEEAKQMVKIQFANELPTAGVGFSPGYSKMSYSTSSEWGFAMPAFASYELDLFLKNHDKTNAAKKEYEQS